MNDPFTLDPQDNTILAIAAKSGLDPHFLVRNLHDGGVKVYTPFLGLTLSLMPNDVSSLCQFGFFYIDEKSYNQMSAQPIENDHSRDVYLRREVSRLTVSDIQKEKIEEIVNRIINLNDQSTDNKTKSHHEIFKEKLILVVEDALTLIPGTEQINITQLVEYIDDNRHHWPKVFTYKEDGSPTYGQKERNIYKNVSVLISSGLIKSKRVIKGLKKK